MSQTTLEKHPFIAYLEGLRDREQRGALAALRRGLGRRPGDAAEMFPYVVPWLPEQVSRLQEEAYYLIASLYATHAAATERGNMGDHFAALRASGKSEEALERRFTFLLAAHPDDLSYHLRQAVSLLKSGEVAVNWNQLFIDMQWWTHPDRFVQRRWARSFWGYAAGRDDASR
jgi:CRISPR system Cascade subunit CasB